MVNARYASRTLLMLVLCVGAQATHEVSRRMLDYDIAERHSVPPPDQKADPGFPRTEATLLMTTPCHPETDGYFGGTSGEPGTLQYGFLMETAIHGDIHTALQAVDEFVMDSILTNIFPEVCGDQRRLSKIYESGRATGFKFHTETIDMERACQPTSNDMNYCAVYSSTILMYGRDLAYYDTAETVLGYARDAIYTSLSAASEYGVVRLIVDDELTKTVSLQTGYGNEYASGIPVDVEWGESGSGGSDEGGRFSPGAKFGLTVSILALIASLVGFFLYARLDKKAGNIANRARAEQLIEKPSFFSRLLAYDGSIGNRGRAKPDSKRYSDEMERSLHVQIEDGKPVLSQFQPSISDSTMTSAVNSVTKSSRGDRIVVEETNNVDSFLNEPNDVDSFLNEPNDIDSYLSSLADSDNLSSLADSVILPEDDPDDDRYLDAFR